MSPSSRSGSKLQTVEDIPTLHDLYASGDLDASIHSKLPGCEALNKRVSIWRGRPG
jgi:hypothetical protein